MVKLEVTSGQMYGNYAINCPHCNSTKVHIDKKGFDVGNSLCGALCLGPFGLLCGGLGKDTLMGKCMNCGEEFDVDSCIKEHWKKETEDDEYITQEEYDALSDKEKKEYEDEAGEVETKTKQNKTFCPECGKKITQKGKFCASCGEKLK